MSRKKAFNLLSLCLLAVLFYSCGSNAFKGIADDSSQEACRYEVTKNLDSGNWDAVLNSSCADSMQKGAAYFGRAGYDPVDVVNRLIDAQNENEPVNLYLKDLVTIVTNSTLNDLGSAKGEFTKAITAYGKDAYFNRSIVNAIEGLALMKVVLDNDGDGSVSNCDLNGNSIPDDVDATVCALMISAGQTCSGVTVTQTGDITIKNKPGTYQGLTINVGTSTGSCHGDYKKLLYKDQHSNYRVAVTLATSCQEEFPDPTRSWPCPVIENGDPIDMVNTINNAINTMINDIQNALPGVSSDVINSITELQTDVCGTDNVCDPQDIANYLNNLNL